MTDEMNLKKIDSPKGELPKVNESSKEHSIPIKWSSRKDESNDS